MLRSYIMQLCKMDVKVVEILKKNICVQPKNIKQIKDGFIKKKPWGVVYKVHENRIMKNRMMYLQDKHCYKSSTLTVILTKTKMYKLNTKDDINCVSDMHIWWMTTRIVILGMIHEVFEEAR